MITGTLVTCDTPGCEAMIDLVGEGGKRIYGNQWERQFRPDLIFCPACKEARPGYKISKADWDATSEEKSQAIHPDPDRIRKMIAKWEQQARIADEMNQKETT